MTAGMCGMCGEAPCAPDFINLCADCGAKLDADHDAENTEKVLPEEVLPAAAPVEYPVEYYYGGAPEYTGPFDSAMAESMASGPDCWPCPYCHEELWGGHGPHAHFQSLKHRCPYIRYPCPVCLHQSGARFADDDGKAVTCDFCKVTLTWPAGSGGLWFDTPAPWLRPMTEEEIEAREEKRRRYYSRIAQTPEPSVDWMLENTPLGDDGVLMDPIVISAKEAQRRLAPWVLASPNALTDELALDLEDFVYRRGRWMEFPVDPSSGIARVIRRHRERSSESSDD